MIELMPVAEFEGRFGWGYDGVDLYAPTHLYGVPDDLRRFVDTAHDCGVAVILDVVYNHLGPVGNYLRAFSPSYFTDRYDNEWGDAINFDGPDSAPVREFFVANAGYWIDEFHLDGLRLDATQQIFDSSSEHVVTAIGRRAREAAGRRQVVIVAENEPQETKLVRPIAEGGYGLDALWNDDFHHSAMVAADRPRRGVLHRHARRAAGVHLRRQVRLPVPGSVLPLAARPPRDARLGPAAGGVRRLPAEPRSGRELGARAARPSVDQPGPLRAMTALLLLSPGTPMLFQGQEFAASAPFLYFADFEPELAAAVRRGRGEFLDAVPEHRGVEGPQRARRPRRSGDVRALQARFRRAPHAWRGLRAARRSAAAAARGRRLPPSAAWCGRWRGARPSAFALRFFTPDHVDDRMVVVNLGADLSRSSFAEPLLAPPEGCDWECRWSSEEPVYGGTGTRDLWPDGLWRIPGESAVVLSPGPCRPRPSLLVGRRTA